MKVRRITNYRHWRVKGSQTWHVFPEGWPKALEYDEIRPLYLDESGRILAANEAGDVTNEVVKLQAFTIETIFSTPILTENDAH